MKVIDSLHAAYAQVSHWRTAGLRVGLVPTMGALHAGHISLVERAREECDCVITTIFVNPTQFGPNEDFSRYPRTLESDLTLLRAARTDMVFTPAAGDIYPVGASTAVLPPKVSLPLEGQFRPHHFQGVATIVLKLFNILPATVAYFGQKDYQQCQVISHMVDELNVPIRVQVCPTIREADGLAMSSRNRYLSPEQRLTALCLWKALQQAQCLYAAGQGLAIIEQAMREVLVGQGVDRIDYARVVDRATLEAPREDNNGVIGSVVALIAAHVGTTRLIDNLLLEPQLAKHPVLHSS